MEKLAKKKEAGKIFSASFYLTCTVALPSAWRMLTPDTLYETLSWSSEPQNIEQEMSNDEVWNRFRLRLRLRPDRSLSLFSKIIMIVRHKSSRQVEYLTSIFVIRFFRVSFSIWLDACGQRRRSYETSWNPMPFSRSISPQSTRRAQRLPLSCINNMTKVR